MMMTLLGMWVTFVVGGLIVMLVGAAVQYDKKGKVK